MNQIAAALIFLGGATLYADNKDSAAVGLSIGLLLFTISYIATSYVGYTRWRTETKNDA